MPVLQEQALGFRDRKGPGKCSNLLISHNGHFQNFISTRAAEQGINHIPVRA